MTTLKPGDAAPLFSATDQFGNVISLESLKGKKEIPKGVIIVTGKPGKDSFRDPSFAPWFKSLI